MSKFCIDCEHYRVGICDKRGIYPYPPNKITCDNFSPVAIKKPCVAEIAKNAKQTLFDQITASPEVLAEKLVYEICSDRGETYWVSTIVFGSWLERSEANAATVAKLKEKGCKDGTYRID